MRDYHPFHARARMFYRRGTWRYVVYGPVKGLHDVEVVLTDRLVGKPTEIPANLWAQAEHDASVVSRMLSSGHEFAYTWRELVALA